MRDWLLFFHILSVIVALSPAVVHPLLYRAAMSEGPDLVAKVARFAGRNDQIIYGTALILAGFFGIALVVETDYIEFSDTWISASFALWIAMLGVLHGIMIPGQRAMAEGSAEGGNKVRIGGPLLTVLALVMLYLMIFKPGADF